MYSLWSNYVYIHRELWHHSKKPFLFQALEIVSQVLTGFFGILLPAGILLFLEQSRGFAGFALGTLVLFLLAMPSFSSAMHLSAVAERLAVYRIPDRLFYAPPAPPFHADGLRGSDRASRRCSSPKKPPDAVCSNWVGVEGMFRYDVTIYSSFLGLLLYAGLIGSVHPAIVLLLLALSVLQFLSYRRAASYEVRRRDDLSAIEVSQRYFQKQSYDTSGRKGCPSVPAGRMARWCLPPAQQAVPENPVPHPQRLLRERSADPHAAASARRHLLWLSDLPSLAHGTMTVSGFVLALGAVSGFSSYFNEITAASLEIGALSRADPVAAGISSICRSRPATRCRSGRNLPKKNRSKSAFPTSPSPTRAARKGSSTMSVSHSMRASTPHSSASTAPENPRLSS